jgi:hypothetical protein
MNTKSPVLSVFTQFDVDRSEEFCSRDRNLLSRTFEKIVA